MVRGVLAATLLSAWVHADDNGLAMLPPMGWRSWNAFYADIDAQKITSQVDALTALRTPDGKINAEGNMSLVKLGFASIGIDEGWEGCGLGINGTVHYANGTPTVDPKRFPDMPGLVRYGHSKGAKMGFYLNGCGCNERQEHLINYEGDVKATVAWGFDAVKIDSCGAQTNMTLYNKLINETGTALEVENCHQGQNITDGGNPGQMGAGWCPYNLFRTSGDITNLWDRVMSNLMTVVPFLASNELQPVPLSRPGCWAYPDMLEVGRMPEHNVAESRSHFSAWAVVSAPLVLGFDLSDEKKMAAAWPIISNEEVLEISQTWVPNSKAPSGKLLESWQAENVPTLVVRGRCGDGPDGDYKDFSFNEATGVLSSGNLCLDSDGLLPPAVNIQNAMQMRPCEKDRASQKWTFNRTSGEIRSEAVGQCLGVLHHWLWNYVDVPTLGGCGRGGWTNWTLHSNGTLSNEADGCISVSTRAGPPSTIWTKSLLGGKQAVLAINGADKEQQIDMDFSKLGFGSASWNVRNVWQKSSLGALTNFSTVLGPHDCALLTIAKSVADDEVARVV